MTVKKTLCIVGLFLMTYFPVICKSQENAGTALTSPSHPVNIAALQQKENIALDLVFNDLLNMFVKDGRHRPIGRHSGRFLLFDSKAWPTYKPQCPQLILGDFGLVTKRMEENSRDMDAAIKFIGREGLWQQALNQLYPGWIKYVTFCELTPTRNALHIRLWYGPSPHGDAANYLLKAERNTWKITKRDFIHLL